MRISTVIVNYKTPELLRECLRSLAQHAPQARDIIVVDNASKDETIALLAREFPQVRRIASRTNAGFAKAVNWGITNAREPYILILNPDVIVSAGSVQRLYQELETAPDIALIAPKLQYPDGSLQYSCCRFQTPTYIVAHRSWLGSTSFGQRLINHVRMVDYDHKTPRDVDWVIGGCMLVRRSAIEEVGLMDERYWLYIEDMDWCRAFWQAGWRVRYDPRAVMTHHYRRQSAKAHGVRGLLTPLGRAHFISGAKYFVKHIGNRRRLTEARKTGQDSALATH
ncbi:MAG: glycosyltransferase family 2 protein [Candidatus Andersenbacteria bacterium]